MQYSIDFAERLIEAADALVAANTPDAKNDAGRAVLYLSRLSCEIVLKALLERAGFELQHIRKRSHNLSDLMADICCCKLVDIDSVQPSRKGSQLLSLRVAPGFRDGTVGTILRAEERGASKYPAEIRYSENIRDYNPLVVLDCARVMAKWAVANIDKIEIDPTLIKDPCLLPLGDGRFYQQIAGVWYEVHTLDLGASKPGPTVPGLHWRGRELQIVGKKRELSGAELRETGLVNEVV